MYICIYTWKLLLTSTCLRICTLTITMIVHIHNHNHDATRCIEGLVEYYMEERDETTQQSESKHYKPRTLGYSELVMFLNLYIEFLTNYFHSYLYVYIHYIFVHIYVCIICSFTSLVPLLESHGFWDDYRAVSLLFDINSS